MSYTARKTGNAEVDREALAVQAALRKLERDVRPSVIVEDVALTTADKVVHHRLGRPITGYRVVRRNAGSIVYEVTSSTAPESWVYLRATVAVVVTLEFF